MRKILFVFTFLACTPQTNAMLIEALPQDLNNKIYISTESLLESAKTINSLAQTNKSLNTFINNPNRTLIFIKELAQKFNCSDEEVANILYTKTANKIYNKQYVFRNVSPAYSETTDHLPRLKVLKRKGLDLNFTYKIKDDQMTALMIASTHGLGSRPTAFWLIENGADINILTKNGNNAFMYAVYYSIWPNLIQCFLDRPDLHINHQNTDGDTPLLCLLFGIRKLMLHPIHTDRYAIVQQMLDKGADPELANNKGQTPLSLARNRGYQPLIEVIENAIVKKHKEPS